MLVYQRVNSVRSMYGIYQPNRPGLIWLSPSMLRTVPGAIQSNWLSPDGELVIITGISNPCNIPAIMGHKWS